MMPAKIPTKDELIDLRSRYSNIEIAKLRSVSPSTVKRWIKKLEIPPREVKKEPEIIKPKGEPMPLDDGLSLMDRCSQILGRRMGEDHRGYMLDGRPASSIQVIRAAGLELRK